MTEFFEEMFEVSDEFKSVDEDTKKALANLIKQLESLVAEIDTAEAHVKRLKQEARRLQMEAIPEVMGDISRLDVTNPDTGVVASVTIKPFVSASIPQDRKEEAYEWLRTHGLDDIIKNHVVLSFGRGEDDSANKLMLDLEHKGFHPESKTHIHASTLKAFVKERVQNGKPIDLDLFGAFVAKTADIKRKSQ